jgi:hypothetical protein
MFFVTWRRLCAIQWLNDVVIFHHPGLCPPVVNPRQQRREEVRASHVQDAHPSNKLGARIEVRSVPFEVSIDLPAGLLNVNYGINGDLLCTLTFCINAGLQPLFTFGEHRFQYLA